MRVEKVYMEVSELKQQMEAYLTQGKVKMQRQIKELQQKGDEKAAKLEMEKLDVYDIFTTMLNASMLKVTLNKSIKPEERKKKFCEDYLIQFITMPKEWRINYAAAVEKKNIEEMESYKVKLDTTQEIRTSFLKLIS